MDSLTAQFLQDPSDVPLPPAPPELHNGDRLTQRGFHRRYEAYPNDVKIELIGGTVFMASPARRPHCRNSLKLGAFLYNYELQTPGVEAGDNGTTILDDENEPQPDCHLLILEECGGHTAVNKDDYIVGAPELVGEVAHSSVAIDLHDKKDVYKKAGVREYIVVCIAEKEFVWFDLKRDRRLKPADNGVIRSKVFPGLWLDVQALIDENGKKVLKVLKQGLATEEHAKFVESLQKKSQRRKSRPSG